MACYNSFTEYSRNLAVDAFPDTVYVSLHSGDPQYVGDAEIEFDGRKEVTLEPASDGARVADPSSVDFEVEAGETVAYVGLWDSETDGNFLAQIELSETFEAEVQTPFRVAEIELTANLGL